jgi:uncharacterized protein YcfJ
MKRAVVSFLTIGVLTAGMVGCETKAGTGALVGGAAGAGLGAIIGNNTGRGHTAGGAAIGGVAGALGGALIGNELDKKDRQEQARERDYYRDRDYNRAPGYPTSTADRNDDRDPYRSGRSNNASASRVTRNDVIDWTRRGDRDDLIIDRIDRSGTVFRLSSRDENQLRDAGVGEEVIRAMKETARR